MSVKEIALMPCWWSMPICRWVICVSGMVLFGGSGMVRSDDWPQWRGPTGQGISLDKGLPVRWDADSANIRWKTPIPGEGASSPVVSAGRVYLTTAYAGEQANPYDMAAAGLAIVLAALAIGLVVSQLRKILRSAPSTLPRFLFASRWSWRVVAFMAHTVVVVALTTLILAKPGWFWRLTDPWTGHMVSAEFAIVETLKLRAVFIAYAGTLMLLFTSLASRAERATPLEHSEPACVARFLAWWMRALTAICTLAALVASVLVVCRSDWFWGTGQPWLAWLVSGGLGLFLLAAGVGWRADGGWLRLVWVGLSLALAGWFFLSHPLNETNEPFDLDLRFGVIAPGCLLLIGHAQVWRMARRKDWPAAPPSSPFLPLLLVALAVTLFVRSNYLQPESGTLRAVLSLDAKSGAVLWQTTVFVSPAERKHALNTFATATPASDGERVYADFGGGLAALDRDGRLLWLIRDPDYARYLRYGAGSSPVLAGDLLIVYRDREWLGHGELDQPAESDLERRPSTLTAYDKLTGMERWRVTPDFSHDSYMTPFVWQHDGKSEIVISTWKTLAGFDLATGKLQWQHPHSMAQMVPSLVAGEDWLLTCGGNELPHRMAAVRPPSAMQAGETLWTSKLGAPMISSPVCWQGMLFSLSTTGFLFCRDVSTGNELWRQRLEGRFLASLVAGDDHVYALNSDGVMFVVEATAKATEPVVSHLGEPCAATPAIANGCLLVRSAHHVICIGGSD